MQLRLLPLTIFVAATALSMKVAEIAAVQAQTAAEAPKEVEAKKEEEKKAEPATDEKPVDPSKKLPAGEEAEKPKEEAPAAEGEKKPEGEAAKEGEEAAKEGEAEGETKEGEEGDKEKKPKKNKRVSTEPPPKMEEGGGIGLAPGGRYFSPVEMELLQSLEKRREQLDGWAKDLEVKENLLTETEKRIDEKAVGIEALKKEVSELMAQYQQQEDAKINSLAKIYQNMKPKDAARIFDELEMPILLLVVDKIPEKKSAPILASMDPKKAKQLTVELAEERRKATQTGNSAVYSPPTASPPPANR